MRNSGIFIPCSSMEHICFWIFLTKCAEVYLNNEISAYGTICIDEEKRCGLFLIKNICERFKTTYVKKTPAIQGLTFEFGFFFGKGAICSFVFLQ